MTFNFKVNDVVLSMTKDSETFKWDDKDKQVHFKVVMEWNSKRAIFTVLRPSVTLHITNLTEGITLWHIDGPYSSQSRNELTVAGLTEDGQSIPVNISWLGENVSISSKRKRWYPAHSFTSHSDVGSKFSIAAKYSYVGFVGDVYYGAEREIEKKQKGDDFDLEEIKARIQKIFKGSNYIHAERLIKGLNPIEVKEPKVLIEKLTGFQYLQLKRLETSELPRERSNLYINLGVSLEDNQCIEVEGTVFDQSQLFLTAQEIDETNPLAYGNLAYILPKNGSVMVKNKKYDKRELCKQALLLDKEFSGAYLTLGMDLNEGEVYQDLNREEMFGNALKLAEAKSRMHYLLHALEIAIFYYKIGLKKEAELYFNLLVDES